jgi:hypothetical protein
MYHTHCPIVQSICNMRNIVWSLEKQKNKLFDFPLIYTTYSIRLKIDNYLTDFFIHKSICFAQKSLIYFCLTKHFSNIKYICFYSSRSTFLCYKGVLSCRLSPFSHWLNCARWLHRATLTSQIFRDFWLHSTIRASC